MRLIIAGCEYSGTTTLANAVSAWARDSLGAQVTIHDHFKFPDVLHGQLTDAEREQLLALPTQFKATFQWHMMAYHVMPGRLREDDFILVGLHFDEAVYAPLYKGYGSPWHQPSVGPIARYTDTHIMSEEPDIVMALVKASPEVIAQRMEEAPRRYSLLQTNDIEHVLQRFEEERTTSTIRKKQITVDTSDATVEESLASFVAQYEPYMPAVDRQRYLSGLKSRAR